MKDAVGARKCAEDDIVDVRLASEVDESSCVDAVPVLSSWKATRPLLVLFFADEMVVEIL
jgi:hypothetical protein